MTEKRFTFADGFKIVAIRENGEIMNSVQVCDKLNELYEENEQLKEDCDNLINDNTELVVELNQDSKKLKEVVEENKELKIFKDKVFEVIDNHILEESDLRKEFIENGSHYSANISRNIIDTLKLIKKEIEK